MSESGGGERRRPRSGERLSAREREILGLLAGGESGAQIARILVLSPETVRTHIRNAMLKLGASSRAQAVALAVFREEIGEPPGAGSTGGWSSDDLPEQITASAVARAPARSAVATSESREALITVLSGLVSLYEVDAGAIFLTNEDGLSLRRVAVVDDNDESGLDDPPEGARLGHGPLGRAALERRAQLVYGSATRMASPGQATIFAPMVASGRLMGVICLTMRSGRFIGRSDLLLLQAFGNRIAEILVSQGPPGAKLEQALARFRVSWGSASVYA